MMTDVEEPPTKVFKMDVAPSSLDSTMEGQEEQEEWLSEGILTDDDYLAGNVSQEQKPIDDTLNSTQSLEPDLTQPEIPEPEIHQSKEDANIKMEQNIEDTLNNFEKTDSGDAEKKDMFDELLKKDGRESDLEQSEKHSDDDGHNTDDLLRMLGGDDNKKKKVLSSIRDLNARHRAHHSSDEDDEYIFQGAKVTRLKVAKNALMRKPATKAEPEDMSDRDSDMSEEDVNTVKKMFTSKPLAAGGALATHARPFTNNVKTEKPKPQLKQYSNTSKPSSALKPKPPPQPLTKREPEEIINEEEFLEDDDFDLDDDMGSMSSLDSVKRDSQTIRRPERMDEEPPSDEDSEDDSLYDVLPSSDSEDMDDWFTLDIRAERAGDYLPWLGDKAHKLLTEEKHRVTARLAALRQSVTALRSTERVQRDQIRVATEALHEIDALLAAA